MSDKFYFLINPSLKDLDDIKKKRFNFGSQGIPNPDPDSVIVSVYASDKLKQQISKSEFELIISDGLLFLKQRGHIDSPLYFRANDKTFKIDWNNNMKGLLVELEELNDRP